MKKIVTLAALLALQVNSTVVAENSNPMNEFCRQERADLALAKEHLKRGVQSDLWAQFVKARRENLKFCQSFVSQDENVSQKISFSTEG